MIMWWGARLVMKGSDPKLALVIAGHPNKLRSSELHKQRQRGVNQQGRQLNWRARVNGPNEVLRIHDATKLIFRFILPHTQFFPDAISVFNALKNRYFEVWDNDILV